MGAAPNHVSEYAPMFRISHSRFARASVIALVAAPILLLASRSALAVDVNADCAAMYGSSFSPVIGQVAAPAPGGARPAKGVPFKDPAFGTCVVRATNHAVEPDRKSTRLNSSH